MPKESGAVRAAFIVRACNSHAQLVAALKALVFHAEDWGYVAAGEGQANSDVMYKLITQARAALDALDAAQEGKR